MLTDEIASFWMRTRKQLAEVPLEATMEPLEEMSSHVMTTYRVIMTSFEHRKIRGWYTVPVDGPPEGGWPGMMMLPGYIGRLWVPPDFLAHLGYATLTLFPRGQLESRQEWELEYGTKLIYNVTDRERYYYRGAYMDCVRGLDFLDSRPEVDRARLGVWGASQGGGLTLATASMDARPKAVVAAVPMLCNFPVAAEEAGGSYLELRDYLADHPEKRQASMETLAYFDNLNLVHGITCPTLVSARVHDELHPYNTVIPVFEKIPPLKSIVLYSDYALGHYGDFVSHGTAWLQRYL